MNVQVNPVQPTCLSNLLDTEHLTSFVQYFKVGGSSLISQHGGPSGNVFVSLLSLSLMLRLHFVCVCVCVWRLFSCILYSFHRWKWELALLRYFQWEPCLLTNVRENTDLEYHTDRWQKKQRSARAFLLDFYLNIDRLYYWYPFGKSGVLKDQV